MPNRLIDRKALVQRHNPLVHALDPWSALTVGNGEFAFTADVTGLQTFPDAYREFPLCTLAHWGWHSFPEPPDLPPLRYKPYDTGGRPVGYLTDRTGQETRFDYQRTSPHRLHLGRIGLEMRTSDGEKVAPSDLQDIEQTLDMWTGLLESHFSIEGVPVVVSTACHPDRDLLAVRISSALVAQGRLLIRIAFPYGSPEMDAADWSQPEKHQTLLTRTDTHEAACTRTLDSDRFFVRLAWSEHAALSESEPHTFLLEPQGERETLELCAHFAPAETDTGPLPTAAVTAKRSETYWQHFWQSGGIIDFVDCTDERAPELERRVVLSQFVTALHCSGSLPSAETGLLCSSWYGKFHLEMHWWHSVHFASWGRFVRFHKSLAIYKRILPIAREIARRQGYAGARWPKMIGPDGQDSPSPVGPLLIWQQPHPIYYAELCWRENPTPETLEAWRDIVSDSADFMASYAVRDAASGNYVLGPPLKTVSENQNPETSRNPTFELTYWRFGLKTAQAWRERLGLAPKREWEEVLNHLALLPTNDNRYLLQEGSIDTFTRWNWEHPALIGAFGMLPGDGVDAQTMRKTLLSVMETWQWDRTWGWDFPMTAFAAARVGEPEQAIRALLLPALKNRFLPNGHNYQRPNLPAYLPANGGLLAAVGMMAAGWTNGPARYAPGFPDDGKWAIRFEGITPWI